MTINSSYEIGLEKNAANYVPLSPLSYIERTAAVYPGRTSVIHGDRLFTWAETYARCRRLASGLKRIGIGKGDTVAAMLPNVPAMYEAHFGVPMAGAILNTLNTRLDPDAIAYMLRHSEAKVLLIDPEFSAIVSKALSALDANRPIVIDVLDACYQGGTRLGDVEYEAFLSVGDPDFSWALPDDEWDAICLNYTSGTTGNPKGVVYHHRGAYLNAASNIMSWPVPHFSAYLWTLPMFHCNGWCFPWAMAAVAGVNVCLRKVDPEQIFDLVRKHHVTHMCGAPIVYNMLINAPKVLRQGVTHKIAGLIAGAAPPLAVLERAEEIGIELTHVYGLTEVYGPAAICAKQPEWDSHPIEERARLNGRQGVPYVLQQAVTVLDPETMLPVPRDGETMGEIFFRGNVVMKGYLKDPKATEDAFKGGWFHTGDLAVMHPDGYVKIKDRSKDIIISGGENISSVEVEDVLYKHPAVLTAAVVAAPDPKWGEVPCAFIELKEGATANAADIADWCRSRIAHFKTPRKIVFCAIPKTSTGKVQKYLLRAQIQSTSAIE